MNRETLKVLSNLQNTLSNVELAFSIINEAICWVDAKWRIQWCNKTFDTLTQKPHILVLGSNFNEIINLKKDDQPFFLEQYLHNQKKKNLNDLKLECQIELNQDQLIYEITYKATTVLNDIPVSVIVLRDITQEKNYQRKLALAERQAGMKDMASSVLHNIGNVLNSIITSITMINKQLKQNKSPQLIQLTQFLEDNKGKLGPFFSEDIKGKHVLEYLYALSQNLAREHSEIEKYIHQLTKHVTHVTHIVKAQNAMSKLGGVAEEIKLEDIICDALAINQVMIKASNIHVTQETGEVKTPISDQVKIMQILVNLIKNSIEALNECNESSNKQLIVNLKHKNKHTFQIYVKDNGIGLDKTKVKNLFKANFTTKRQGHGLGLHASAIAAKELGGALYANSDGVGKGMTMILELPYEIPKDKYTIIKNL
ncbi:MAG: GHKL domain-containing protein [Gammaproteobacteria bacterium]|nr:MAG: GHKL domain-containing protein [Gammaproteobacteria bacterium]UTW42541.1 ATP-binding protein [bacterium SCSIO 12844]